jgi:hypothetical protein
MRSIASARVFYGALPGGGGGGWGRGGGGGGFGTPPAFAKEHFHIVWIMS